MSKVQVLAIKRAQERAAKQAAQGGKIASMTAADYDDDDMYLTEEQKKAKKLNQMRQKKTLMISVNGRGRKRVQKLDENGKPIEGLQTNSQDQDGEYDPEDLYYDETGNGEGPMIILRQRSGFQEEQDQNAANNNMVAADGFSKNSSTHNNTVDQLSPDVQVLDDQNNDNLNQMSLHQINGRASQESNLLNLRYNDPNRT